MRKVSYNGASIWYGGKANGGLSQHQNVKRWWLPERTQRTWVLGERRAGMILSWQRKGKLQLGNALVVVVVEGTWV